MDKIGQNGHKSTEWTKLNGMDTNGQMGQGWCKNRTKLKSWTTLKIGRNWKIGQNWKVGQTRKVGQRQDWQITDEEQEEYICRIAKIETRTQKVLPFVLHFHGDDTHQD